MAKDVCDVLELANVSQALMALDSDEKDDINISDANNDSGRLRKHRIISEPGLYKLTFRSTKPEAKRLTKWVTTDVTPFGEQDMASLLGYSDTDQAVRSHCKLLKTLKPAKTAGLECGPRGIVIIPESDVYRLILRSKKEEAERVQDWVTSEVLPSIRKTGSYSLPQGPVGRLRNVVCPIL